MIEVIILVDLCAVFTFDIDEQEDREISMRGQTGFGDDRSNVPEIFRRVVESAPGPEDDRLPASASASRLLHILVLQQAESGRRSCLRKFASMESIWSVHEALILELTPIDLSPVNVSEVVRVRVFLIAIGSVTLLEGHPCLWEADCVI